MLIVYASIVRRRPTLTSAPEAPGMASAIFFILMPRMRFIFLECIFKMSTRAFSSGAGNSILRSIRPARANCLGHDKQKQEYQVEEEQGPICQCDLLP